jgi:ketopantoate reductase
MRILVIGAGAIGGMMAAKLAVGEGDNEVSVVDMGAHLESIKSNGLKLIWEDGSEFIADNIKAYGKISEAGDQDLVIFALKAHYMAAVAADLKAVLDDNTMLMTVQNGMPWWYFQKHGGPYDGRRLETLDPRGTLEANIDPKHIVGCVVYPAAGVVEPGVIKHVEGDRFPIGELDGSESPRIQALFDVLVGAGFRSRILDNIRSEIWLKAWGNLSFNPISALSHATLEDICIFPETRLLAQNMMEEAQQVGNKLGIEFRHTIEKRIDGAQSVGPHKTSMLQDVEAGRSLEIEALVGSIIEMARITDTPTPHIDAVYACTKLLNQTMERSGSGVDLV